MSSRSILAISSLQSSPYLAFALAATVAAGCASGGSGAPEGPSQAGAALGGWPSCGTVLTAIDSPNGPVAAYSNAGDFLQDCGGVTADGDEYQCVELAQRYFRVAYGISVRRVATAALMCGISQPELSILPPGGYVPVHGDLMVFGGTSGNYAGHVAVVDSVVGSFANVVEQNASITGTNQYALGAAECFIHPAGAPVPSGSGACLGLGIGGQFCGNDRVNQSGMDNTLFVCGASGLSVVKVCQICVVQPDPTQDCCAEDPGCTAPAPAPGGGCNCDGTDNNGQPVSATACGQSVCGQDDTLWTCDSSNTFQYTGTPCSGGCSCEGTDNNGQPVSATACGQSVCGQDDTLWSCDSSNTFQYTGTPCN